MNIARYNGHCRRRRRRAPRGLVGGMQRGLSYLAFGGKSLGHGHGLAGRRGPAAGGRAVSPLSIDGRLGGPAAVTNWTAPDDAQATTSLRRNERSTAKVTTTAPCRRRGASVWTTCPESLRSRAPVAGDRTHVSPAPPHAARQERTKNGRRARERFIRRDYLLAKEGVTQSTSRASSLARRPALDLRTERHLHT